MPATKGGPPPEEGPPGAPQFVPEEVIKPIGRPEAYKDIPPVYRPFRVSCPYTSASELRGHSDLKGAGAPPADASIDPNAKFVDFHFRGPPLPPGLLGPVAGWTRVTSLRAPNTPYEPIDVQGPTQPAVPCEAPPAASEVAGGPPGAARKGKTQKVGAGAPPANKAKEVPPPQPFEERAYSLVRRKRGGPPQNSVEGAPQSSSARGLTASSKGPPEAPGGALVSFALSGASSSGGGGALQQELYGRYKEEKLLAQADLDVGALPGAAGGPSALGGGLQMIVSLRTFCTRSAKLGAPPRGPFGRWLHGVFAFISECAVFLPRGFFLWELLHPQTEGGFPLLNPQGLYGVRLFLEGAWRVVDIDDLVPHGGSPGGPPVFPMSADPRELWAPLLAKAILKAFRGLLASEGGPPPVIEALTGRREVALPLCPSLLSAYTLRGLWASVKLKTEAPAAAAVAEGGSERDGGETEREGSLKAGSIGWTPFLVAAVKEEGALAVSLVNRQAGDRALQQVVGPPWWALRGPSSTEASGATQGAEEGLRVGGEGARGPGGFSGGVPLSLSSEEALIEFSGALPLSSPQHPFNVEEQQQRAAAAAAAAAAAPPQVKREKEGGPIRIARPYAVLLQHLLGGGSPMPAELDAEEAFESEAPPASAACAAGPSTSQSLAEKAGNHRGVEAPAAAAAYAEASLSQAGGGSDASLPASASETPRPTGGQPPSGSRSATAFNSKGAALQEAFKTWGVPWAVGGPPPVPPEGLRLLGGPWLSWKTFVEALAYNQCSCCSGCSSGSCNSSSTSGCRCAAASFSVYLPEQMLAEAPLKDLYDYERGPLPIQLPLRASVSLFGIPRTCASQAAAAGALAVATETEEEAAAAAPTAAEKRRSSKFFRPHAVLLFLEGSSAVEEEQGPPEKLSPKGGPHEAASAAQLLQQGSACCFLNLDRVIPHWRKGLPQIAAWAAATAPAAAPAAAPVAAAAHFNAAAGLLMGPETANTLAVGWGPPCCSHEEKGPLKDPPLMVKRLRDALLTEDLGALRLGVCKGPLQMLCLARGLDSLTLETEKGAPLSCVLELSSGLFAFLTLLRAPAAAGPLTVSWRRPLQQQQQAPAGEAPPQQQQGKRRGGPPSGDVQSGVAPPPGQQSREGVPFSLPVGPTEAPCKHVSVEDFLSQPPLSFFVQQYPFVGPERGPPGSYSVWFKAEVHVLWSSSLHKGPSANSIHPYIILLPQIPHAGLVPFLRLSFTALGPPRRLTSALEGPQGVPCQGPPGSGAPLSGKQKLRSGRRRGLGGSQLQTLPLLPFLKIPLISQQQQQQQEQQQHGYFMGTYLLLLESALPPPSRAVHCSISVALPPAEPPGALKSGGPRVGAPLTQEGLSGADTSMEETEGGPPAGTPSPQKPLVVQPVSINFRGVWEGPLLGGPQGPPLDGPQGPQEGAELGAPSGAPLGRGLQGWLLCNQRIVVKGPQPVRMSLSLRVTGAPSQTVQRTQVLQLSTRGAHEHEEAIKGGNASGDHQPEAAAPAATHKGAVAPHASISKHTQKRGVSEADDGGAGAHGGGGPPRMPEESILLQEDGPGVCVLADVSLHPHRVYVLRAHCYPAATASLSLQTSVSEVSLYGTSNTGDSTSSVRWLLEAAGSGEILVGKDISREEFNFSWLAQCDPARGPREALSRAQHQKGAPPSPYWRWGPPFPSAPKSAESLVGGAGPLSSLQQLQQLLLWKQQMTLEEFFAVLQAEALGAPVGPQTAGIPLRDAAGEQIPFELTQKAFCCSKLFTQGPLGPLLGGPEALETLYDQSVGPLVAAAGGQVTPQHLAASLEKAVVGPWGLKSREEEGGSSKGAPNNKKGQGAGGAGPDKKGKGAPDKGMPARQAAGAASRGAPPKGGKEEGKREKGLSVVSSEAPLQQFPVAPQLLKSPLKPEVYMHPKLRHFVTTISGDWPHRVVEEAAPNRKPLCFMGPLERFVMQGTPQDERGAPIEAESLGGTTPSSEDPGEILDNTICYIEERRALLQQQQEGPEKESAITSNSSLRTPQQQGAPFFTQGPIGALRGALTERREALRGLQQKRREFLLHYEETLDEETTKDLKNTQLEQLLQEAIEAQLGAPYEPLVTRIRNTLKLNNIAQKIQEMLDRPSSSSSSSGKKEERKFPKRRNEKEAEGTLLLADEAHELRGLLTDLETLKGAPRATRPSVTQRVSALMVQAREALSTCKEGGAL
ncbi:hypothetical protein Esti_002040 [Eimeria stiedai]